MAADTRHKRSTHGGKSGGGRPPSAAQVEKALRGALGGRREVEGRGLVAVARRVGSRGREGGGRGGALRVQRRSGWQLCALLRQLSRALVPRLWRRRRRRAPRRDARQRRRRVRVGRKRSRRGARRVRQLVAIEAERAQEVGGGLRLCVVGRVRGELLRRFAMGVAFLSLSLSLSQPHCLGLALPLVLLRDVEKAMGMEVEVERRAQRRRGRD